MQITNTINRFFSNEVNSTKSTTNTTTSKQATLEENISKSFDTFEYKNTTANRTTYSPSTLSSKTLATTEASQVQTTASTSSVTPNYNVIVSRAAKNAGIAIGANGEPRINSAADAKSYNAAKEAIESTYWCQTGGWDNLSGDGSTECARTASATMASINSGSVVTPNDTGAFMTSVTVDGTTYSRQNGYSQNYDVTKGAASGFSAYGFSSEDDLIDAINTELSHNRSVIVHVTTKKGSEHWVTVTGTNDGKAAESFSDLMGVDPWYNGSNTEHGGQQGIGDNSCNESKSGVIALNTTCTGFMRADNIYGMVTFNVDT